MGCFNSSSFSFENGKLCTDNILSDGIKLGDKGDNGKKDNEEDSDEDKDDNAGKDEDKEEICNNELDEDEVVVI